MFEKGQKNSGLSAPQDQVVVLGTPIDVDVDLLWEAFLAFVEHIFKIDVCDENYAEWSEVAPIEFDAKVRACLIKTSDDRRMHGIWGEDRLAIVAPKGLVSQSDWSILLRMLQALHDEMQFGVGGWTILASPSAPVPGSSDEGGATLVASKPTSESGFSAERIAKANRHLPVPATPEQRYYLAVQAAQPDGRHPVIIMEPVFLELPDKEALVATIEALQERHESLFTAFVTHEDTSFIVLDDSTPLPLERVRVFNPVSSIAAQADQKALQLAKSLQKSSANWRACLIEARKQTAVVCVFSKTIADQSAVDQFRSELIFFYEAFRAGRDPEADTAPPALQYTDFAALKRDNSPATAWWEQLLPYGLFAETAPNLPFMAPVNRWQLTLPSDLTEQILKVLDGDRSGLEAVFLSAFLRCIHGIDQSPSAWFVLPVHDQRPADAEGCLGQFTRMSPVWVQDLADAFNLNDLAERLAELRAHRPLGHRDLTLALPGRIPARIPYAFEFTTRPSPDIDLYQQEDFSLVVRQSGDQLVAHWAIRLDHPQSHRQKKIDAAFCTHLSGIVEDLLQVGAHAAPS